VITEITMLVSGVVISAVAMTIGIGGGILWTPLMILGFGLSPIDAISTSLMIQTVGLASGSIAFFFARLVDRRLAFLFFLAALPGVLLGSYIGVQLSQRIVQMALGIMSLTLAILFVSNREPRHIDEHTDRRQRVFSILPIPGVFGFAMGLLSVGIGEWLIPTLKVRLGFTMRQSVATVVPVMLALALVAATNHALLTHSVHWDYFIWGALGAIIGGQLGPRLAQRINEGLLKDSFIYLMTLVGIHLIFQSV
jgi:uncharacterized protein